MKAVIYYFSGTGNSLYVAKGIAAALDAELLPIASSLSEDKIRVKADVAGIVFPVYYGDLPLPVRKFAKKLTDIQNIYLFSVCTFGGAAGDSHKTLKQIVQGRGGQIAATYGVHMPQNAFYKFWEKHRPLYRRWQKNLPVVVANTISRREGTFFRNILFDLIFKGIQAWVKPRYAKSFAAKSGISPDLPLDELIHFNDVGFKVHIRACTGCGLCEKVCPAGNIEMQLNKPFWRHQCWNCLACYNYCPEKAISSSIAAEGYYYRHPDITVQEIMAQKKRDIMY
jgi:flavodoxin/ferredoxin